MFVRAVTLATIAIVVPIIWLLCNHSIAQGAPVPIAGSNTALNRQLESMAFPPARPSPARTAMLEVTSPRTPVERASEPNWLTSPAFLAIAAHFTAAERLLHYRRAGWDANFWGVLNRNRVIRIGFSVRL